MNLTLRASNDWRLREAPFSLQRTFNTPLGNRAIPEERDNLSRFVKSLLSPFEIGPCEAHIELFVFEPRELIWYLRGLGITTDEGELNSAILKTENASETRNLLECLLGQWADFALFDSKNRFVVYADHDEYTTIFTSDPEALESLGIAIREEGFNEVQDWQWTGPHSKAKADEGTNV